MKKYSSIILALLLILTAAVPASIVGAQNNSNFSEIIQEISGSENFSQQEKEDIFDKALELHYDEGVSLNQVFEVLNQNGNYNDIENQLSNLEVNDDDYDADDEYDDDDDDYEDDDHDEEDDD